MAEAPSSSSSSSSIPLLTRPPPSPPPPPQPSLYVGDLEPQVTEKDIVVAFSRVSPSIASVRVCRDFITGQSLRYGYVNFFNHCDAAKVMDSLNHTYLLGKPMRIMWSQRNPVVRKSGVGNLFVKNLDASIDSAGLQEIFSEYGTVLSCKVEEECGIRKGFGFVQLESEETATAALNALDGTVLKDKKLYVSKFIKKSREVAFTNLYVKNLDQDLTEEHLQEKFSEFGKVRNVVIMKNDQGKSKGFGFINFESPEDAKKAVEAMNGIQLGAKKIFVGKAQKKSERELQLKHQHEELSFKELMGSNVYVKNLDDSIDSEKLRNIFSSCGRIISAKVMRYESGISKRFGFVCFSSPDEAKKAVATFHMSEIQGRRVFVDIAQHKEDQHLAKLRPQKTISAPLSSSFSCVPPGFTHIYSYHPKPFFPSTYRSVMTYPVPLSHEVQSYPKTFTPEQKIQMNECFKKLSLLPTPQASCMNLNQTLKPTSSLLGDSKQQKLIKIIKSNHNGAVDNQKVWKKLVGKPFYGETSSKGSRMVRDTKAGSALEN